MAVNELKCTGRENIKITAVVGNVGSRRRTVIHIDEPWESVLTGSDMQIFISVYQEAEEKLFIY